MAKNTAHAIAIMLIVGAIICSFIAKFHCETTTPKLPYYIVSNIDDCVKKCRKRNHILKNYLIERKECTIKCVVEECNNRHAFKSYKWQKCYDYLYQLFVDDDK
ncbi:hypothetical protein PIB30_003618 [Stylosanthes scabra]|uniref:Uncharacterized protein n=1 Tax=Stylosanthes scabra TaxID=79078 RepID=A0ABU6Y3N6_9FABA|nr:hypothetical protein [Stylosanthes scabra]